MRILIADDDFVSCRKLEMLLVKWGYEVVSTGEGVEAYQRLISAEPPALAILDWMMPDMDGVEICRRLRTDRPSGLTYVILLTARGRVEDIALGLQSGADDYIIKPFQKAELFARIKAAQRMIALQEDLSRRIRQLEEAHSHIRTLQGIIPICSFCHRIRDDSESWQRLEAYISMHSEAQFSHGICPECLAKNYPDVIKNQKE